LQTPAAQIASHPLQSPEAVLLDGIEDTSLYRLDADTSTFYRYPRGDYLLSTHFLRSGVIHANVGHRREDGWVGTQCHPAKSVLLASRPLGVRHLALFAALCGRCYETEDALQHFSLAWAASVMGYKESGGGPRLERVREALLTLYDTDLVWHEEDERGVRELHFRLLDAVYIGTGAGATAKLSGVAQQLLEGFSLLTYLKHDVLVALIQESEHAARLWMFLESDRQGRGWWHYRVFRNPTGEPRQETNQSIIAEVLGVDGWKNRGRVVEVIRKAIAVIVKLDGDRWSLRLERGKGRGMWNVKAKRHARPRPAKSQDDSAAYIAGGVQTGTWGCTGRYAGVYGQVCECPESASNRAPYRDALNRDETLTVVTPADRLERPADFLMPDREREKSSEDIALDAEQRCLAALRDYEEREAPDSYACQLPLDAHGGSR